MCNVVLACITYYSYVTQVWFAEIEWTRVFCGNCAHGVVTHWLTPGTIATTHVYFDLRL